ncbi:MAG TPA: hypothetical protein VIX19_20580 [Terriglobales bacterium]
MPILLLLLVSVVSTYFPDPPTSGVKIVSRQVTGGISDIKTEYLTANRMRNEWQTHMGERTGPPMASIILRGSDQVFLLDLQAKEYVTYESDSQGPTLGSKSRLLRPSGGVLQIWVDSVDTGERSVMFGHMARHIVTREKRIASPGACSRSSESEIDGWYIDDSVMPEWHRPKKPGGGLVVASVVAFGADSPCIDKVDTIEMHRSGVEPGFPLKINTVVKSEVRGMDGSSALVASNWGSEVTDLQEGPLDPALFEVPPDFRRVAALKSWSSPLPRRQLSAWDWIKLRVVQLFQ